MWRWRETSARCSMSSPVPEAAGSTGCWDEISGTGGLPVCNGLSGGGGIGIGLWFSAPPGAKTWVLERPALCDGGLLGMAVLGIRHLPGGLSGAGTFGDVSGRSALGTYGWKAPEADFLVFLENSWKIVPLSAVALEKNLENHENFVCICGKMGYNRME